jgi:hypothetical protein
MSPNRTRGQVKNPDDGNFFEEDLALGGLFGLEKGWVASHKGRAKMMG